MLRALIISLEWGKVTTFSTNWEFRQAKRAYYKYFKRSSFSSMRFFRLVSASFPRHHFTHIFIDEAGHATEPECIIPVADLLDPDNYRGGQLVLAGDPKQLGPILRCKKTQDCGLGGY